MEESCHWRVLESYVRTSPNINKETLSLSLETGDLKKVFWSLAGRKIAKASISSSILAAKKAIIFVPHITVNPDKLGQARGDFHFQPRKTT